MMRKFALLALLAAALAVPSIAAAATPQGKLTGSAQLGGPAGPIFEISTTDPVIDGGTTFVGLENDKSGNCDGDSGTAALSGNSYDVVCAHYIASSRCCPGIPKMRLALDFGLGGYALVRITDNGPSGDTWADASVLTFAEARAWVNKGAIGGGGDSWSDEPIDGNFTVCGVCP